MSLLKQTTIVFILSILSTYSLFANVQENTKTSCATNLNLVFLRGEFILPSTGENMQIWVGKTDKANKQVQAFLMKENASSVAGKSGTSCFAQCDVGYFERFKSDSKPAFMEMDCKSTELSSLRMPLYINWARSEKKNARKDNDSLQAVVRLGSSLYGIEQAKLKVSINQYESNALLAKKLNYPKNSPRVVSGVNKGKTSQFTK